MSTKLKKTEAAVAAPTSQVSTPRVGAAGLLGQLAAKAKPKAVAASSKDHPDLVLTPEAEIAFSEWVPAKLLGDIFEEHLKNANSHFKSLLWCLWLDALWATKRKPNTFGLTLKKDGREDLKGQYTVKEQFKVQIPIYDREKETIQEVVVRGLCDLGIAKHVAEKLVASELDMTPVFTINFTALLYGTYQDKTFVPATEAQQNAAEKFLRIYKSQGRADRIKSASQLTDAECAVLEESEEIVFKTVVKKGFFDRVCDYATTRDEVESILRVVQPQGIALSRAKLGISDSEDEKQRRLIATAADVLGATLNVVEEDAE